MCVSVLISVVTSKSKIATTRNPQQTLQSCGSLEKNLRIITEKADIKQKKKLHVPKSVMKEMDEMKAAVSHDDTLFQDEEEEENAERKTKTKRQTKVAKVMKSMGKPRKSCRNKKYSKKENIS